MAMARLRSWDRSSSATMRTSSPTRSRRRCRCASSSEREPATSNRRSTRVFERLACWPPGPPLGENRRATSLRSMAQVGVTSSHSVISGAYSRAVTTSELPAVVLVHGFATSCARTWGETGWLDLLADSGRQVIGIDLLGHGQAPKPHDPEAYSHMEDLVLEAFPEEPVDAVGFSLGARTLLALASAHPERFNRLIVAGVGANLFGRDPESGKVIADAIMGETGHGE